MEQVFLSDPKELRECERLSMALAHTNVSAMQLNAGRFRARLGQSRVGAWMLQSLDSLEGASTCSGSAAFDRHCFVVPLAIGGASRLLGKELGNDEIGVYAPGSEHADVSTTGLVEVVLMPPPILMQEALARGEAISLPERGSALRAIPAEDLQRLRRSLREARAVLPSLAADPRIARAIGDALEIGLLAALAHASRARATGRTPMPRLAVLKQLTEALQTEDGDLLYASDLVRIAGVSYPTLRRVFVEWFGASPLQYLMLKRLYLARRRLLSGEYRTVVDAAMSCGFWELGRFSGRYHTLFGERPSESLMRVNGPPRCR